MFVVVTSEWQGEGEARRFAATANVYGPFPVREQAEKFRSKYCYESVAVVRPVLKERQAEFLESQKERLAKKEKAKGTRRK